MSLGQHDYACDMFVECVKGDPGNIIYLQSFLANLRRKYGEKKRKSFFSMFSSRASKTALQMAELSKNWKNALESCLALLKANPWNSAAFFSAGRACLELGYKESGLAYLKHSIEASPNDLETNRVAARVLADLKKFDDAIVCWARILKLKPNDTEAEKAIGDLTIEKTIHRGGYEGAESSREVKKGGMGVFSGKAGDSETEDVLGRQLTFEEQIERRLKKNPQDVGAYVELGEYHFQAEHFAKSVAAYQKALELNPNHQGSQELLLESERRQLLTELTQLKAEFEKKKTVELKQAFYAKKELYDRKNLEVAQFRIVLEPGNTVHHFELGTIYYKQGLYKEAIGEYQLAKMDKIKRGEALLALGQCFQQIKQYKLALTHFQQAVQEISEQGESRKKALYLTAKLALGLKEYEKADEYANQLAAIDFSYKDVGELLDKIAKSRNNA